MTPNHKKSLLFQEGFFALRMEVVSFFIVSSSDL